VVGASALHGDTRTTGTLRTECLHDIAYFGEARRVLCTQRTTNPAGETHMENRDNGTGSTLDSKLDSIKDSVKGLVDENRQKIKNRVIDAKDQAMARGNMYVDRVTDMIKANPLKAVGIAFGVGYIGMRLFRR
jgi:ElaB/YqjD/DUF883 family membrane-anchored ribosome-binding protein